MIDGRRKRAVDPRVFIGGYCFGKSVEACDTRAVVSLDGYGVEVLHDGGVRNFRSVNRRPSCPSPRRHADPVIAIVRRRLDLIFVAILIRAHGLERGRAANVPARKLRSERPRRRGQARLMSA